MTTGKPDELAVDVANRVLDHLRTMYPDALKAVPASAQISLRNVTISAATAAILAAKAEEREAIIQVCEAEKHAFLSPEYAAQQPIGSICERFAIDECIAAIRKRGDAPAGKRVDMPPPDFADIDAALRRGAEIGNMIVGGTPAIRKRGEVNTAHKNSVEG